MSEQQKPGLIERRCERQGYFTDHCFSYRLYIGGVPMDELVGGFMTTLLVAIMLWVLLVLVWNYPTETLPIIGAFVLLGVLVWSVLRRQQGDDA